MESDVSCGATSTKMQKTLGFGTEQRVHTIVINASRRPP